VTVVTTLPLGRSNGKSLSTTSDTGQAQDRSKAGTVGKVLLVRETGMRQGPGRASKTQVQTNRPATPTTATNSNVRWRNGWEVAAVRVRRKG
jgi:hypothetical protein